MFESAVYEPLPKIEKEGFTEADLNRIKAGIKHSL